MKNLNRVSVTLNPIDSHKSFYGKAVIRTDDFSTPYLRVL